MHQKTFLGLTLKLILHRLVSDEEEKFDKIDTWSDLMSEVTSNSVGSLLSVFFGCNHFCSPSAGIKYRSYGKNWLFQIGQKGRH
jgi:hypothetical protein